MENMDMYFNKQIFKLNEKLIKIINNYPIGLADGKMGLCIYYFWLSRLEKNKNYQIIAENLLDDIINDLSLQTPINLLDGMAGIAVGLTHLNKRRFIDIDINDTLEDIDAYIFNKIVFSDDKYRFEKVELLHLLYYIYIRLVDQKDENQKFIFQELLIEVVNKLYTNLKISFFTAPVIFSVYHYHLPPFLFIMGKLLSLNIYNEKIIKIMDEFSSYILSELPILQINRLYLLCGMVSIKSYYNNSHWEKHINILKNQIDINWIIDEELTNKRVFISNGLGMIYLLLAFLKNYPEYTITFNTELIRKKILESEAWNALYTKDYFYNIHKGLLNGFCGIYLVLSFLKKSHV